MENNEVIAPEKSIVDLFKDKFASDSSIKTIPRIEILEWIKNINVLYKEEIIKTYNDGKYYNGRISGSTYFDKKYNKTDYPDMYQPVLFTYHYDYDDYYGTKTALADGIGFLRNTTDNDGSRLTIGGKNIKKIVQWNYASDEIVFAFLDVLKSKKNTE